MSLISAKAHLAQFGADTRVVELAQSSATVELATQALGCEPRRIAKSIALTVDTQPIVIVVAGDAKLDNAKYKHTFKKKAKMLSADDTLAVTTHPVGGVCPFGLPETVTVYLDESLKRFPTVFPACGSRNSAIEVSLSELETFTHHPEWVDVCKDWQVAG